MGGSNGGLLVGVTFTQRPELFKAVVCQVPLLDMLRYTKLLAGASWVGEYGDPDNPEMRRHIRRYSPFHNLSRQKDYPTPFFVTSTKDDRVHPGHARKMAARMISLGHPVYYFENIEGGHGAECQSEAGGAQDGFGIYLPITGIGSAVSWLVYHARIYCRCLIASSMPSDEFKHR